jgi:hypothetical protein
VIASFTFVVALLLGAWSWLDRLIVGRHPSHSPILAGIREVGP